MPSSEMRLRGMKETALRDMKQITRSRYDVIEGLRHACLGGYWDVGGKMMHLSAELQEKMLCNPLMLTLSPQLRAIALGRRLPQDRKSFDSFIINMRMVSCYYGSQASGKRLTLCILVKASDS
jgi:hypothetical protein